MADAFTLATTLPPFLFSGNQSVALAPVVSATYEVADHTKRLNTNTHLFQLEAINRSIMSGRNADKDVEDYKKTIKQFHMANIAKMPATQTMPVLGRSSLTSATMKHSQKAME